MAQTTSAVYVCSKCGLQFEQHDLYRCHDAQQHTDTEPMQASASVSSGQQVDASDAVNVDSWMHLCGLLPTALAMKILWSFVSVCFCSMSGWMFLLVLAYPGNPAQKAIKWLCVFPF